MAAKNTRKAKTSKKFSKALKAFKLSELISLKTKTESKTKLIIAGLLVLLIAFAFFKFRYLVVPATVNGRPIFIWTYLSKINNAAGQQVLNQLVAESLITQEIEEKNVVVEPEEIDAEIAKIEEQLASEGGLEALLASQGSTRDQLRENIELSLKVEKLISGKVSVTDEEIDTYYNDNQEYYNDLSKEEAKSQIREDLQDQKLEQEFSSWLDEIRNKALIKIYLPGLNNVSQTSN